MAPDIFEAYLEQRNFLFKRRDLDADVTAFLIDPYRIPSGRLGGRTVGIGLPIPTDFPRTAPYGVHVRGGQAITGPVQSSSSSPLGDGWLFWSRKANWEADRRTPQYYMDQVVSWLGGAA